MRDSLPIRRLGTFVLCLASVLSAWTFLPGPAPAEDLPEQLREGDRMVKALPSPAQGEVSLLHFEIRDGEKAVGWSRLSLRALANRGEPAWDYLHELSLSMPSGAVIRVHARAVLRADFSVVEISHERKGAGADGTRVDIIESARMEGGRLHLRRVDDGVEETRVASPPNGIAVTGLEFLLPRIARSAEAPFALRELDPADGSVSPVVISVLPGPDRTTRIDTSRDGQTVDEYYLLDSDGALLEFGDPDTGLVERRSTAEKVKQLEATIGR